MTAAIAAGAPLGPIRWDAIHWPTIHDQVRRLQVRIAKAAGEGDFGRVKALQWILTHSWHAKMWAVRRVTTNKGAKTPGVDGVTWRTGKKKMAAAMALKRHGYHPQPLRRIYIPKSNGKLRPLGIPTMHDRAMQALACTCARAGGRGPRGQELIRVSATPINCGCRESALHRIGQEIFGPMGARR